jgi:hypothetical protein
MNEARSLKLVADSAAGVDVTNHVHCSNRRMLNRPKSFIRLLKATAISVLHITVPKD